MSIIKTIKSCLKFFNINSNIEPSPFNEHSKIDKSARGVYILEDENKQVIYVGKGNIKARQILHWKKAVKVPAPSTVITSSWKWLRENHTVNPEQWTLYYINLDKETELSAMEGALIHLLQPLANDETFKDREKIS